MTMNPPAGDCGQVFKPVSAFWPVCNWNQTVPYQRVGSSIGCGQECNSVLPYSRASSLVWWYKLECSDYKVIDIYCSSLCKCTVNTMYTYCGHLLFIYSWPVMYHFDV